MDFEYRNTLYFRKLAPEKISITSYAQCLERSIIFAGLSNGCIIAWDLCISIPVARVCVVNAHEGPISALYYHQQSNLLISGGVDHIVSVWDPIFSDIVDVSGVEKLKIEQQLKNDAFYVKHGGTVLPPILPDDQISQNLKKTVLVQQLADFSRQIVTITSMNKGLLILAQDGSVTYYNVQSELNLKYPKFKLVDQLFLGYEKPDVIRQMEILNMAASSKKQLYTNNSVMQQSELIQTIRGVELATEGQNNVSNKIYPTSVVCNYDDNSIFIGDSVGQIHLLEILNSKLVHKLKMSEIHRLGVQKMVFLQRENSIISCSSEGCCRGFVSMTGQIFFTTFNQRVKKFKEIISIQRHEEIVEEVQKKSDLLIQAEAATLMNNKFDDMNQANIKMKLDQIIALVDADNYITLIDSSHGQIIQDTPYTDIMPNLITIQQDLEKYNIDTTFPIVCDFRSSKNQQMYAIQKQNTSASDEYKLLKLNYRRQVTDQDAFLEHPFLSSFESSNVVGMFIYAQNKGKVQNQLFVVRDSCLCIYNLKNNDNNLNQNFKKKQVKLTGLLLISIKPQQLQLQQNIQFQQQKKNTGYFDLSQKTFESERSNSPFGRLLNKYRLRKVQLKQLNEPINKLGALTPYLQDDLDAIESFIQNNLDGKGELADFQNTDQSAIQQNINKMSVPFYVIVATEDNQISNYDPRVSKRPYHLYKQNFSDLLNATQMDFSEFTKIKSFYKKLQTVIDLKKIKGAEEFIKQKKLPLIQPILSENNVYTRLAKSKNTVKYVDLKKEMQFKYYHTLNGQGYDNTHNLGMNDQDVTYTITEDVKSLKNDVNKMGIDVKKVSQLPDSTCFCLLVDTETQYKRDVLACGHEDGSLTFQDLMSNSIIRVYGGHSIQVQQITYVITPSGYQIISFSNDGRFLTVQVPKIQSLRLQYISHSIFNIQGESVCAICAYNNCMFLGTQSGKVYVHLLPLTTTMKNQLVFDGSQFFMHFKKKFDQFNHNAQNKAIHTILCEENCLYVLYENGFIVQFYDVQRDIDTYQDQISRGISLQLEYKAEAKKQYLDYVKQQFTMLPNEIIDLLEVNREDIISTIHIALPLQNAEKILDEHYVSNQNQEEIYVKSYNHVKKQLIDEDLKKRKQDTQQKTFKVKQLLSETKSTKPGISLKAIMNGNNDIVIDQEKLTQIGEDVYIMVGTSDKKLRIIERSGKVIQETQYNQIVTSVISVNRGALGERVLSQLAKIYSKADLLKCFWVGLKDGQMQMGTCDKFLE